MTSETGRRQARGERKRREVLEAAIRLLAREGPRAVTHRAVAAEAGTSLRATTYYFASREELLTEALRHYAQSAIERFEAIRAALPVGAPLPVSTAAELLAQTVLSDVVEDRAGLVAEYELVLEVGRNAALEAAYAAWQQHLEGILALYAKAMGSAEPALHARIVLATLRGLEIEALARPSKPPRRADLKKVFQVVLESLVARGRSG
jgi:DNA-binding transcriptional regulator YbjK